MAHGSDGQLGKGLRQRHLAMIAIGGVIGAGLFVGSGAVIAEVGPAAFITYALTGVLIIMVMRMLGEMAASNPATGSFAERTTAVSASRMSGASRIASTP